MTNQLAFRSMQILLNCPNIPDNMALRWGIMFDKHLLLMNALEATGKTIEFLQCTYGFLDTKILFKTAMPRLSSYAHPYLVTYVTG